jgi:hypothetical protein
MRCLSTRLILGCFLSLFVAACHPRPPEKEASAPQNAPPPAPSAVATLQAPKILPGNGLTQHDFFYAGESRTRDMYIVRKGQIVWSYHDDEGKGEISDAVLMSNGNILFAHQFGVTEITPDKKVVWNYDAPPKYEIHTAKAIGRDRVLFIENGEAPKLVLVNIVSGKTERDWPLKVKTPLRTHGQFRHMSLTDAGTLLVAHMDSDKVSEYDVDGKEIWSVAVPGPWSASRLKNGNTLVVSNAKFVREVDPSGKTVWEFTPADVPDYKAYAFQTATRLSNGNTLINNWTNQWHDKIDPSDTPVQAWEITPDKKVVWALRSWTNPANLGPATTIQLLDEPGISEQVHFGTIK